MSDLSIGVLLRQFDAYQAQVESGDHDAVPKRDAVAVVLVDALRKERRKLRDENRQLSELVLSMPYDDGRGGV